MWTRIAVLACVAGCGGNLRTTASQDSNQSDAAGQAPSVGGDAADVDDGRNPYIPSNVVPVADADPRGPLDNPGSGFDFCGSRTAGNVTLGETPPATQGERFFHFTTAPCEDRCSSQNPSDAQLYTWPSADHAFDVETGIYFDVIDLGVQPSMGSLRIYGTDEVCEMNVFLNEVPLTALAIETKWSTRCIPLGPGTQKAIGIAVTAGNYDIGIDAIRFGPACR